MQALETIHVQSKYQLVFVQIQAAAKKLTKLVKSKEIIKKQKAFYKLRSINGKSSERTKVKEIMRTLKKSIKQIIGIRKTKEHILLIKFVLCWRSAVNRLKTLNKSKKRLSNTEEKYKKELAGKDRTIAVLQRTLEQRKSEVDSLKETESKLKLTLEKKEEEEKVLQETIDHFNTNNDIDNPNNNSLRIEISKLEKENKDLKERIEAAEENVGDFIKEVGEILDSREFASTLGNKNRI